MTMMKVMKRWRMIEMIEDNKTINVDDDNGGKADDNDDSQW